MKKNTWIKYCFFISLLTVSTETNAWVYPEHREIGLIAIGNLNSDYRNILNNLWLEARTNYEKRLSENVIVPDQGLKPTQLDYASWFAISGDHSCSPENLLYNVLQTEWILKVADIAAKLKIDIADAKNPSSHINAIRESDIRLQRADLEYATRAGSNNVHFLLARPNVNTTPAEYLKACLSKGAPLNALGAYAWFHINACYKAARYASENLSEAEKSKLILSALADEAFALHFLEDVYAAGHIAGTWGVSAVRKGTHDYYNEKGLEVATWKGEHMVVKGDAYMRGVDADLAALNVRKSIEQFLDAASGKLKLDSKDDVYSQTDQPDSFNVCKNNFMLARSTEAHFILTILENTPIPGLATGDGALPRFRSEFGTFFGFSSSIAGSSINGGFGKNQTQGGVVGSVDANLRWGFGLDGVLNVAGDGLVFIQAGWRLDGASSNTFTDPYNSSIGHNTLTAAIPGRSAYNFRLRMPFWLIPGDLLVFAPIVYIFSPKAATGMAVIAGNGGLIPWQSGISTSIGRFQFILGREIGVSLYGLNKTKTELVIPTSSTQAVVVQCQSTKLDFPILEYRPFRSFSFDQTSAMLVQIFTSVDIPHHAFVLKPDGAAIPELKDVWSIGLRILFDWRKYY
ncbi:MAG TPA: hypothetical protein VGH64_01130 [Puia sp.]